MLIGGLLFALGSWQGEPREGERREARPRIVLTAGGVARLRREWVRQHGVLPAAARQDALIEEAIDEEVLYREALSLGLDRGDRVVRARLLQVVRSLGDDGAGEGHDDEEALLRRARSLGLDRSDLVVHRYLVQTMRLVLSRLEPADLPTEAEIEAYFRRHAGRYRQPERLRITHVYLSRSRRGEAVVRQAERLLAELRRARVGPEAAPSRGDPFVRGPQMLASMPDLDRTFGPGFAAALAGAEMHIWVGPVHSSYGEHLVWIHERLPSHLPPLAAVRNQVLHRLLRERGQERLASRMRRLRGRYAIEVQGPPGGGAASPAAGGSRG